MVGSDYRVRVVQGVVNIRKQADENEKQVGNLP